MRILSRTALVVLALVGCVGCDQTSKAIVRASMPVGEGYSYLGGAMRLVHAENTGGFLSLGDSLPPQIRYAAFTLAVGGFTAALLFWCVLGQKQDLWRRLCIAVIAAGGAGNLIDRIFRGGSVTDFMYLGLGWLHTGIFNVADVTLMLGLAGAVLGSRLFTGRKVGGCTS